jgi:hypothetical protein
MTHKEFYFWLEGYLTGKLEDNNIDISPIVEKMQEVKDVDPFFPNPPTTIPKSFNPKSFNRIKVPLFNADEDELGKPPKIVM